MSLVEISTRLQGEVGPTSQLYRVGMENYERGEKLGEGAWGVVTSAVSLTLTTAVFHDTASYWELLL